MNRLFPVILSGGAGTRLWPVSRETHPKPFMRLPGGESLLQKTFMRAAALSGVTDVLTVTNRDYYFKTKDEYASCRRMGANLRTNFLLEPFGRNTAPAVALAALRIRDTEGPGSILLILPADHLITDTDAFGRAVQAAQELAAQGCLVTFGITPTEPETGYGYIEVGSPVGGGGCRALRFVEKPSLDTAREYLASGRFVWNSGMFCFQAGTLLAAMESVCPEVLAAAQECWTASMAAGSSEGATTIDLDSESFGAQPDISLDYAVMERVRNVSVIPCEPGWSDIGSWNALGDLVAADERQNRVLGDAVLVGTRNTFIHSEHHLVAAVGIQDAIIVDTPDAVLVVNKHCTQEVRKVVEQLKVRGHDAYRLHRTVSRPWGTYTVLEEGSRFKIKRIEVRPGASLSMQMHHHRSEHWIVVCGTAKVTNGEREFLVNTDESTYIAAGKRHRLENPGVINLVMIEVQSGDYVGEDDIIRFEDIYGRVES